MSTSKRTLKRRSPVAVVLLLATAMIAAGVELLPNWAAGPASASDDGQPDSQPCEESQDELAEDEEIGSGKHAALVGVAIGIEPPAAHGPGIGEPGPQLQADMVLGSTPIRGPPLPA